MNKILLECKNLCKFYKENGIYTKVLNNLSFHIMTGEMIAVIGESGSGKSTLLHLLGGLDTPTSGEIIFNKKKIHSLSNTQKAKFRNQELGFIYQFHHLLSDFNIVENVAMPLFINNEKKELAIEKASILLSKVGLISKINYFPSELSGGERQRVAIARALINRPKLILADEPTGNLDTKNTESIFNLLINFNKKNTSAFLIVTHNLKLAKKLKKQIYIKNGKINFIKLQDKK